MLDDLVAWGGTQKVDIALCIKATELGFDDLAMFLQSTLTVLRLFDCTLTIA